MAWRTIIAGLYYVLHFKVYLFHLFVVCFQGKEKAERSRASGTAPSRPTTRMEQKRADRRRETLQQSAQKHREKQSLQKKRQVNEKRMAYYYRVKAERKAVHQGNMEKSVQVERVLSILLQQQSISHPASFLQACS